ncbi:hypothetical protein CSCA_1053 [Clostridium scatologenes]|uniref:Uncharacterized protein n=1 Tax=Clostridium scatologenes TaxID=1548 RepID=A0A0E3M7W8_CLOSL|nr:hypothetical protein CSCA_1053 [Clostridium scatologenes]
MEIKKYNFYTLINIDKLKKSKSDLNKKQTLIFYKILEFKLSI